MKGIQISTHLTNLANLQVSEIPEPVPNDDEYLVEVRATAANFFEVLQIAGKYQNQPALPWTAGVEFSGVIVSTPLGTKNPKFRQGARVFGVTKGAFATKCVASELSMLPVPREWSLTEAAGLFISVSTAYGALVTRAAVKEDDYVLIHAAAGGTGLAAVQVAKARGAKVIATASTASKLNIAKSFGADYAVNYTDTDWPRKVKEFTPGNLGVNIVFDPVGLVDLSSKCTAWNGRILIIGFAGGVIETVPMNRVLLKNISLVGFHGEAYGYYEKQTLADNWRALFGLIRDGKIRSMVFSDRGFVGLGAVKDALVAVTDRETWGKVTVQIPKVVDSQL